MNRIFNARLLLRFLSVIVPAYGKDLPTKNARLTVWIYNDARVSRKMLASAERAADAVFQRVGLGVEWVNYELQDVTPEAEQCNFLPSSTHFEVRIRPNSSSHAGSALGHAYLGADGCGQHSVVFLDRVEHLCPDQQADKGDLLGHVIAHEVGHLLGVNRHSRTGLMETRWADADLHSAAMGRLLFTRQQGQLMRSTIAAANTASDTLSDPKSRTISVSTGLFPIRP
jgi:hypothetical protein